MQDAGADGDGARDSAHPHGGRRARGGPVPELPFEVPPPALHRAVREERAGVLEPAANSSGARESGHSSGDARTYGGPVAELPLGVPAPALHRAVPKQRTGVIEPAADGGGTGESTHPQGGGRARESPVAELAVVVPSPALRRAVPKQRTRVIAPGDNCGGARDSGCPHRGGRTEEPRGRRALAAGRGDAELPVGVPPPAPHRAIPKECTTVVAPGGDGDGAGDSDHGAWHGGDVVEGPVAALPGVAHPPALHRAVPKQRARVGVASDHARRGGQAPDGNRHRGVGKTPVAVAELPEVVPPPALHRPVGQSHTCMQPAGGHGGGDDGSTRRKLLRLAHANGGIRWRDGDALRGDLSSGPGADEHQGRQDGAGFRPSVSLVSLLSFQTCPGNPAPFVTLRDWYGCPHDPGIASGTRAIRLNHELPSEYSPP